LRCVHQVTRRGMREQERRGEQGRGKGAGRTKDGGRRSEREAE